MMPGPIDPQNPLGAHGSEQRKKAVKRYFRVTPPDSDLLRARRTLGAGVVLLVTAVTTALVGLVPLALVLGAAAITALGFGWQRYAIYRRLFDAAEPKPADHEIDTTLRSDLRRVAGHAMSRFGLDNADLVLHSDQVRPRPTDRFPTALGDQGRGPIVVFGPARGARARVGQDRVWRFSVYDVLVVAPTPRHLAVLTCRLDLGPGTWKDESTDEFHYSHIVAVTTRPQPLTDLLSAMMTPQGYGDTFALTTRREVQVVVASGDRTGITVGLDARQGRAPIMQPSGIDELVAHLRGLLRERRDDGLGGDGTSPTPVDPAA
jgi:hypothetical protein